MLKLFWLVPLTALFFSCTVADHNETVKLTPEEVNKVIKERDYLSQQIASKDIKVVKAEKELETTKEEIKRIRNERDNLTSELEARLAKAQKLMEEAKELTRKLRPLTKEEEDAAEKLFLQAEFFRRDNPTESKSLIASKYKLVINKYPRSKAAGKAQEKLDELNK